MKTKRFTKESWLLLGFEAVRENNAHTLTIEELCTRAGKTRGSFYFHFEAIDEYLEELATLWFTTYTTDITSTTLPNTKRLDLLNQLVTRLDLALETGIRNLAGRNAQVQSIVTKADQARIEWLAKLYTNSGSYTEADATALAHIEIAAFTGFRMINPKMPADQARQFYENFLKFTNR